MAWNILQTLSLPNSLLFIVNYYDTVFCGSLFMVFPVD